MVTKRSLILALWGLVIFVYLYYDRGVSPTSWPRCVSSCLSHWQRRGRGALAGAIELGLLRHPLRREVRAHLLQGVNIWLCCGCSVECWPPVARTSHGSGSP